MCHLNCWKRSCFQTAKPTFWSDFVSRHSPQAPQPPFSRLIFAFTFLYFQGSLGNKPYSHPFQQAHPSTPLSFPDAVIHGSLLTHNSLLEITQSPSPYTLVGRFSLSLSPLALTRFAASPAQLSSIKTIPPTPQFLRPTAHVFSQLSVMACLLSSTEIWMVMDYWKPTHS